jgi:hypothetical protein
MTPGRRCWLLATLLLGSGVWAAEAQAGGSTTVVPVQQLTFGNLVPGVPEVVTVNDVARRAMIALSGSNAVDVTFLLPAALESMAGGRIPLQFGTADGGLMSTAVALPMPVNPHESRRVVLVPDHAVHLLLGGVALPARGQAPGHYAARVIVLISHPGT